MLTIYNLLQIVLLFLGLPILVLVVLLVPKYRRQTMHRLGFGLAARVRGLPAGHPRIWVHGLSVGEVASARALVKGLRTQYPEALLIFSASTSSGLRQAEAVIGASADLIIAFPLDLFWSVNRFVELLAPDLFVLVETDLWPNFLAALRRRGVPAVLVNGRISGESLARYRHFPRFFAGLFNSFTFLAMQTGAEVENLAGLGVAPGKLLALGNLKYGAMLEGLGRDGERFAELRRLLAGRTIWVAGSTHPGEEEVVLRAYLSVRERFPELYLILAPRKPGRAGELVRLAERFGLRPGLRSRIGDSPGDLLLLDTMGELAELYACGELAFVGGSLVAERGHNPLEPAGFGRPVLFGPHMEDFAEIAEEMLAAGAAQRIGDESELAAGLSGWLADPERRRAAGRRGAELVAARRGVTQRHLALLRLVLEGEGLK